MATEPSPTAEAMRLGAPGGLSHPGDVRLEVAVANALANSSWEQIHVLWHDHHQAMQLGHRDAADVDAIDGDDALLRACATSTASRLGIVPPAIATPTDRPISLLAPWVVFVEMRLMLRQEPPRSAAHPAQETPA